MPIFEYECSGCGEQFEFLALPGSAEAPTCPACQGKDLQQMLSTFAVDSKSTRDAHMKTAKERANKIRRDVQYEDHKRIHRIDDHSH